MCTRMGITTKGGPITSGGIVYPTRREKACALYLGKKEGQTSSGAGKPVARGRDP